MWPNIKSSLGSFEMKCFLSASHSMIISKIVWHSRVRYSVNSGRNTEHACHNLIRQLSQFKAVYTKYFKISLTWPSKLSPEVVKLKINLEGGQINFLHSKWSRYAFQLTKFYSKHCLCSFWKTRNFRDDLSCIV